MRYLLALLGLMFANTANAINCETPPTCESLGYTTNDDPDCAQNGYMYCPFNNKYKKCVERDCAALGFTNTDKTSWCADIVKCSSNEEYTACACAKPIPEVCKVGSVYYADGNCSAAENYNGCGKPVGVVYYVSDGGAHGKVINLHDLSKKSDYAQFNPKDPYASGTTYFKWGKNADIPGLTDWDCDSFPPVAKTENRKDPFWSAGKDYTKIIADYQHDLQYAPSAAHAFYPYEELENDSNVGKGHWYLPTLGELMDLYEYNYQGLLGCYENYGAKGNTLSTVNAVLTTLKNKGIIAEKLMGSTYWSSSGFDEYTSWGVSMYSGGRNPGTRDQSYRVRVSLEF